MTVSETERNELYVAVRELLGERHAGTMMNLLPPAGWGDIATRRDLEVLESSLRREIEVLDASLRQEMAATGDRLLGQLTFRLMALNISFAAVLVAAIAAT